MKVKVWELVAGVIVLLAGVIVLIGGNYAVGVVTIALVVFVLALRTRIVEGSSLAGGYALRRARLEVVQTVALTVVVLASLGLMAAGLAVGWNKDVEGQIAIFALAGVSVLLTREIERRTDSWMKWLTGGRAEARVGEELRPLREKGWLVEHDVLRGQRSNVDHVVCGPGGAYVVETKSGSRARAGGLAQARWNAAWLSYLLRQGWVIPILCLDASDEVPHEREGVWVMGTAHVRSWLETRKGRGIDLDAAAAALRSHDPGTAL